MRIAHRNCCMAVLLLSGMFLVQANSAFAAGSDTGSSATTPAPMPPWNARHQEKVKAAQEHKFDLLLIGDSITHNLDNKEFQTVWNQFYAPRNALDLGYSGARTENTLWFLQNGELTNQSPKAVVLLIGTNNSDDANYPVVHTPEQIAEGTAAIVKLLREKLPTTKILLLRIFPRTNVYMNGQVERGSMKKRWDTNLIASELVAKLADGKWVHYLDVNHVFLRLDGTINPELMPDLLHPSPKGALLWAKAMEPKLCELMGDKSHDTDPVTNAALVPTPKIENDSYDWYARHEDVLKVKNTVNPEVVMIGDSITHFWAGPPYLLDGNGNKRQNGPASWQLLFGSRPVLNMGFGWDRTQNVLWRFDHGEFDGLHPKYVVLNIGTNNFSTTANFKATTPAQTFEAIRAICIRIRSKSPDTRIIVMGVFPVGQKPEGNRAGRRELNKMLADLAKTPGIQFLDISRQFLNPDDTIQQTLMGDFCHPTEQGYALWAKALKPYLDK